MESEPETKRWRRGSTKSRQTVEDPASGEDTDSSDGTAASVMEVQDGGFISSAADDTDESDVDADESGSEFDADESGTDAGSETAGSGDVGGETAQSGDDGDETAESGDDGGEATESGGDEGGEAATKPVNGRRVTGVFS